jgi:hypothetical protein
MSTLKHKNTFRATKINEAFHSLGSIRSPNTETAYRGVVVITRSSTDPDNLKLYAWALQEEIYFTKQHFSNEIST